MLEILLKLLIIFSNTPKNFYMLLYITIIKIKKEFLKKEEIFNVILEFIK